VNKSWLAVPLGLVVAGGVVYRVTRPIPVVVAPVVRGTAVDAVYATGTVEAEDRVDVKAKTSGSVADLLVREGSAVKKGDLLARIDNPVVSFELKRGKAEAAAAAAQAGPSGPQLQALRAQAAAVQAELSVARKDLERLEGLARSGALPEAEVDRARARVQQLEANLSANEAQQRALRIDLGANAARTAASLQSLASRVEDTEVRAPMDGVVLGKRVEPGEVVAVNQTLFRIGDTRRLILEVTVDEADISRVHDGRDGGPPSVAAVSLLAFGATIFPGKVFEILPDANRERKAFLAKVRLDAPPPGLRSGMTAEVNVIASEKPGVLLVPTDAVQEGSVWAVRGDKLARQEIRVGMRDLLRVEVVEGLAEGERVVLQRSDKLAEGKRVVATEKPADRGGGR
jgi:RND family efflux transporter MFP subunit